MSNRRKGPRRSDQRTNAPVKYDQKINSWKRCHNCDMVTHFTDVKKHSVCPPKGEAWDYSYIYERTLYSFIKKFVPKDKSFFYERIIQMSMSAAQVCGVAIGDVAIATADNNRSVALTLWPFEEDMLSTVFLTDIAMKELECCGGEGIKVKRHNHATIPVSRVKIKILEQNKGSLDLGDEFTDRISSLCSSRLIMLHQLIVINYFGISPMFEVVGVLPLIPNDMFDSLSDKMNKMTFRETELNVHVFRTLPLTKWEVEEDEAMPPKGEDYKLSKLGGLHDVIIDIKQIINQSVEVLKEMCGLILHGPSGTGKTYLIKALAADLDLELCEISVNEIYSKVLGESEYRLTRFFKDAVQASPSIIVIDNMDAFCPTKWNSDYEKRLLYTILQLLEYVKGRRVVVIGITKNLELIDPALRRPGRFDYELKVPIPDAEARYFILQSLLKNEFIDNAVTKSTVQQLASTGSHGFVGADLCHVYRLALARACETSATEGLPRINDDHLSWAFTQVKPSAMREILVEVPNVYWSDIGGQEELKLKLQQVLDWPFKHPDAFSRLGITPPRGILLYGPPGCSKTMIAKAVATECKLNFISIRGAEIFSKWVGDSERAVRELFDRARAVAPSVVFFDEIDALAGEREAGGTSGVQERVLSQLLTELDGIQPLSNVTVVAATNRPDRIDSALLRPGRLDRKLYVPLPDFDTRESILILQFSKMPTEDVDFNDLVLLTNGYSGAEIVSLCHEAAMKALQENLNTESVKSSHFSYALSVVKPRTPSFLLEIYRKFSENK